MDNWEAITAIVASACALVSVVISIIALVLSGRAQSRSNELQERIVQIEERRDQDKRAAAARADLRASLRKTAKHTYRLVISNDGSSGARKIALTMDGKPFAEHPASVGNDLMPDKVGPRAEISCLLAISMGCTPPFDLEVSWDDDSGADRSFHTTLTF